MIKNPISGSKVTVILLKGWIWPSGKASVGEGLRLQPAQQACFVLYEFLATFGMVLIVGFECDNVCSSTVFVVVVA